MSADLHQSRTLAALRDRLQMLLSAELSVAGGNLSELPNSSRTKPPNP